MENTKLNSTFNLIPEFRIFNILIYTELHVIPLTYIPRPYLNFYFEIGNSLIAQTGLELVILLSPPPQYLELQNKSVNPAERLLDLVFSVCLYVYLFIYLFIFAFAFTLGTKTGSSL